MERSDMSYSELKGKVAVVTGGGKGIGRATALAFAREGVQVAVVDLSDEDGQTTVSEIERLAGQGPDGEKFSPAQAIYIKADVSKLEDARQIAAKTYEAFGRIDILHNNAGIQTYGTVV